MVFNEWLKLDDAAMVAVDHQEIVAMFNTLDEGYEIEDPQDAMKFLMVLLTYAPGAMFMRNQQLVEEVLDIYNRAIRVIPQDTPQSIMLMTAQMILKAFYLTVKASETPEKG